MNYSVTKIRENDLLQFFEKFISKRCKIWAPKRACRCPVFVSCAVDAANEIRSASNWNMQKALIWIHNVCVPFLSSSSSSPLWQKVFRSLQQLHAHTIIVCSSFVPLHIHTSCFTILIAFNSNVIHEIMKFCCFSSPPTRFANAQTNASRTHKNNKFKQLQSPWFHSTLCHRIAKDSLKCLNCTHRNSNKIHYSHMNEMMTYTFHPFHFIYLCILLLYFECM